MVLFATVFSSRDVVRAGMVITVLPSKFAFTMFINRFLLETLAKEVRRFSFMNIEQEITAKRVVSVSLTASVARTPA